MRDGIKTVTHRRQDKASRDPLTAAVTCPLSSSAALCREAAVCPRPPGGPRMGGGQSKVQPSPLKASHLPRRICAPRQFTARAVPPSDSPGLSPHSLPSPWTSTRRQPSKNIHTHEGEIHIERKARHRVTVQSKESFREPLGSIHLFSLFFLMFTLQECLSCFHPHEQRAPCKSSHAHIFFCVAEDGIRCDDSRLTSHVNQS